MNDLIPLSKFPDPPHCPQWALNPLTYQQKQKLNNTPGFDQAVKIVQQLYHANNCDTLIDIGCWLGVLSLKFHNAVQPKKIILVDAVPLYLRMCRELFAEHKLLDNVWALPMCIVPDPSKYQNYFVTDLNRSMDTSNLLNQPVMMKDRIQVHVPTHKPAVTPYSAARVLSDLITPTTYVKIDIDGMDYAIVTHLVQHSKPAVISFECLIYNDTFKTNFIKAMEKVQEAGYSTPDVQNLDISDAILLDLFVSKDSWAVMVYTRVGATDAHYNRTIYSNQLGN